MSEYLTFFELDNSPFEADGKNSLVLGTKALRRAYAQIEKGLEQGSPRICVNGKDGMGKTSLARALPRLLGQSTRVVVLLNPALPWDTLRAALVKQLDLEDGVLSRRTLLRACSSAQRLVLVIDQAESISKETLEHLDILLGYLDDDERQVLHCVLLANLERATRQEECALLWWLDSLTTLQLEFSAIPLSGIDSYIRKHLKRAGWKGGDLFTPESMRSIHRLTSGVPREVSRLCESALEAAAERGMRQVNEDLVLEICGEKPSDEADAGGAVELLGEERAATRRAAGERDGAIPTPSRSSIDLDAFFQSSPQPSPPAELTLTELADPEALSGEERAETSTRDWKRVLALAAALFGALLVVGGVGWIASRERPGEAAVADGAESGDATALAESIADAPLAVLPPVEDALAAGDEDAGLPEELRLTRRLGEATEGATSAFGSARAPQTTVEAPHPSQLEDGVRYWLGE